MKSRKNILSLGIIVLVLFLGVGYAVVSSVYLNISGTASVANSELNVEITNAVATTNVANKTVDFSHQLSNKNLTSNFTLNEMELGEKIDITYTVTNNENDVDAELASSGVAISNTNPDHFRVNYVITDSITDLANNDKTMEVVVSVELIKTAVTEANGTTTVGLTIVASPKGSGSSSSSGTTTSTTPLKFGQKYYVMSMLHEDISGRKSWTSFYEDGTSITADYSDNQETNSGFVYEDNKITGDAVWDGTEYIVSDDGKFINWMYKDNIYGMFVLETEYNNLIKVPVKFSQTYTCTTDNTSNQAILGTNLKFYPDGTVVVEKTDNTVDKKSSGSVSYTPTEIIVNDSDTYKIYVSSDGKTITQKIGDSMVAAVYELDTEFPYVFNLKDIGAVHSVVLNNVTIGGSTLTNHKLTWFEDDDINTNQLYNASIYIESENKVLPYVTSVRESYTEIYKFSDGETEMFIAFSNIHSDAFGVEFRPDFYISDLNGDLANEDIEIIIDYTKK